MKLSEVENLYFEYEDKKHEFLQETQAYFLNKGYRPYVWLDERHRLRVKQKHERTSYLVIPTGEISNFLNECVNFAKENDLTLRFIQEYGEIDKRLPDRVQEVWSTEVIFEV